MNKIEWQPIETVPISKRVMLGMYLPYSDNLWDQEVGIVNSDRTFVVPGNANFRIFTPTHWHMLLDPPENVLKDV